MGCRGCVPIPMVGVAEKQGARSAFGYRDMPHPHPALPHSAANCRIDWAKRQTEHGTRRRGSALTKTMRNWKTFWRHCEQWRRKGKPLPRGSGKTGGRVLKRGRRKNNKTSRSSGAALAEPKGDRFESGVRVAEPPFLYAPRRMALLRAARRPSVWDGTIRAGENPATYGAQRERRRYGRGGASPSRPGFDRPLPSGVSQIGGLQKRQAEAGKDGAT